MIWRLRRKFILISTLSMLGVFALIFVLIVVSGYSSLDRTMDELTEKKQQAKLDIFTKLRNLLVASVVVATSTLIVFSYIILSDKAHATWKFQWL